MKTTVILFALGFALLILSCSDKTTQPYPNTVSTPVFNISSGIYLPSQVLTITCQTAGATIRYTMDGSMPDKEALLYSSPILLDSTQTIRAVAYKEGWNQSAIASSEYEIYHPISEEEIFLSNITATPDSIYADGGTTTSVIRVKVLDHQNVGLAGQSVIFQTSLGTITPDILTDEYGFATAVFRGDDLPGTAQITTIARKYHPEHPGFVISADTLGTEVRILPPQPAQVVHSIQFMQPGQIDLEVQGTGGATYAVLRVRLLDEQGILVLAPHNVWFRIISLTPPAGVNLDYHPVGDSVNVVSADGIAQIIINSGTGTGLVAVQVSCQSGDSYIQAVKHNVVIHAGAPHLIEVFGGGFNTGVNVGQGLWRIVVGARVSDINGNPMDNGVGVWFSLPDDTFGSLIVGQSYVGSNNMFGDSTIGVAYTVLTYSGLYTFESINVRATCMGYSGNMVFGEEHLILPLNQPQMSVGHSPGFLVFHGNENSVPNSDVCLIATSVIDGQGLPINNAGIEMTTDCGVFEPFAKNIPKQREDTAVVFTSQGIAYINIRFFASDVPPGNPQTGDPGTRIVTMTFRLIGTDLSSIVSFTLQKFPT